MANLTLGNEWVDGVYRLETNDPVLGGEEGISNLQAKQLGARDQWLRAQIINLQNNGFTGRRVRRENLVHGVLPTNVRNAVMSGPVDSAGAPTFISFTPNTKNILINGSPVPVRFSFAAGYDDFGQIDYPGKIAIDLALNIDTGLGMPNNNSEVTIFAEHTPTTEGGSTTVIGVLTSQVFLSPNPPAGTAGVWWNPNLQIWLRWNPDFGGGWTTPAFLVPLARLVRNSSGNIIGMIGNKYREGIEGTPSVPVGTIIWSGVAHTSPPAGYLHCNGAALQNSLFPDLFNAIGIAFGSSTAGVFNLPDLRGEFVRGADAGRNVDVGRVVGSSQGALVGTHKHQLPFHHEGDGDLRLIAPAPYGVGDNFASTHVNGGGAGASSTVAAWLTDTPYPASMTGDNRPRNVALNAFIRYI
jgi:hypothetical protein